MPDTSTRKLSRTEIALRVKGIITEQLGCGGEFPESSTLDELGLDSLDAVEIVMSVEESFEIALDFDDLKKHAPTVGRFIDLVEGTHYSGSGLLA